MSAETSHSPQPLELSFRWISFRFYLLVALSRRCSLLEVSSLALLLCLHLQAPQQQQQPKADGHQPEATDRQTGDKQDRRPREMRRLPATPNAPLVLTWSYITTVSEFAENLLLWCHHVALTSTATLSIVPLSNRMGATKQT